MDERKRLVDMWIREALLETIARDDTARDGSARVPPNDVEVVVTRN